MTRASAAASILVQTKPEPAMKYLRLCYPLLLLLLVTPARAQTAASPGSPALPEGFTSYTAPIREATLTVVYPEDWHLTNVFEKNDWRPVFALTRKPANVYAILEGFLPVLKDNALVFVSLLLGAEEHSPMAILRMAVESLPASMLREVQVVQPMRATKRNGEHAATAVYRGLDRNGNPVVTRHVAVRTGGRLVHVFTLVAADQEADVAPLVDQIIAGIRVGKAPKPVPK